MMPHRAIAATAATEPVHRKRPAASNVALIAPERVSGRPPRKAADPAAISTPATMNWTNGAHRAQAPKGMKAVDQGSARIAFEFGGLRVLEYVEETRAGAQDNSDAMSADKPVASPGPTRAAHSTAVPIRTKRLAPRMRIIRDNTAPPTAPVAKAASSAKPTWPLVMCS